jgi:hypothetical protein
VKPKISAAKAPQNLFQDAEEANAQLTVGGVGRERVIHFS